MKFSEGSIVRGPQLQKCVLGADPINRTQLTCDWLGELKLLYSYSLFVLVSSSYFLVTNNRIED